MTNQLQAGNRFHQQLQAGQVIKEQEKRIDMKSIDKQIALHLLIALIS